MMDGYTYSQNANSHNYYCSKKDSGCKARIKLAKDGRINQALCTHFHERPRYNNHARNLFYCSKRSANCKSSVRLDDSGRIIGIRENHEHAPPKYIVAYDGTYLKISS
ncbi:unnamed protein product, partial [Iphiclides podalirius]